MQLNKWRMNTYLLISCGELFFPKTFSLKEIKHFLYTFLLFHLFICSNIVDIDKMALVYRTHL